MFYTWCKYHVRTLFLSDGPIEFFVAQCSQADVVEFLLALQVNLKQKVLIKGERRRSRRESIWRVPWCENGTLTRRGGIQVVKLRLVLQVNGYPFRQATFDYVGLSLPATDFHGFGAISPQCNNRIR